MANCAEPLEISEKLYNKQSKTGGRNQHMYGEMKVKFHTAPDINENVFRTI
jgi:hypothetical protein